MTYGQGQGYLGRFASFRQVWYKPCFKETTKDANHYLTSHILDPAGRVENLPTMAGILW